jgi:hypothetical protein
MAVWQLVTGLSQFSAEKEVTAQIAVAMGFSVAKTHCTII